MKRHLCLCVGLASMLLLMGRVHIAADEPTFVTRFDGNLDGWTKQLNRGAQAEFVFDQKTAVFGESSLCIKPVRLCAPDDRNVPTNIHLRRERFAMEPRKTYLLSAWVRSNCRERLFTLGARRVDEPVSLGGTTLYASQDWRRYEAILTVDKPTTDVRLQIIAGMDKQPLWVDCVAFRKASTDRLMPAAMLTTGRNWAKPEAWEGREISADPEIPHVRIGECNVYHAELPESFRFDLVVDLGKARRLLAGLSTEQGREGPGLAIAIEEDKAQLVSWKSGTEEIVASEELKPDRLRAGRVPVGIERWMGQVTFSVGERERFRIKEPAAGLDRLYLSAIGSPGQTAMLNAMEGYEVLSSRRLDGSSEKTERRDPETGVRIVRLTHSVYNDKHAYYDLSPWSPDGSKVVFCSALPKSKNAMVYVMDADGTNIRKVGEGIGFGMHAGNLPVWASDGKSIYYHTRYEDGEQPCQGTARVFLDSGKVEYLPFSVRQVSSATGRLLASCSIAQDGKVAGLYSYAADGRDEKLLATMEDIAALSPRQDTLGELRLNLQNCKWSPDGTKAFVVFCARNEKGRAETVEVYVVNADGTDLHFATSIAHHPIWHPNSLQILYNARDGLYVVNADGTNNHKISDCAQGHPSYSPDGKMIVTDGFGGEFKDKLILIDAETGTWKTLCNVPTAHGRSHATGTHPHPCWAPDGKSVIYDSDETGLCQLYQVFLE